MSKRLLLLNRDPGTLQILAKLLRTEGYDVAEADGAAAAQQLAASGEFGLVVWDIADNPDAEGEVLGAIQSQQAGASFILVGGSAECAAGLGGCIEPFAVLAKPYRIDALLATVQKAVDFAHVPSKGVIDLNLAMESGYGLEGVVAESTAMRSACEVLSKVATANVTVLLLGERGTYRGRIAQAVHGLSRRADAPYVAVDCSAPDASSRLMGETGDSALVAAEGGTVYLGNVDELALETQGRLGPAIRTGQLASADGPRDLDLRVIASAAPDVEQRLRDGTVDEGLFGALKVIVARIPPLRLRREDIMPTVRQALRELVGPGGALPGIDPDAVPVLEAHDWPGNADEVMRVMRQAWEHRQGDTLGVSSLPATLSG